jgi:hypothetical protein
MVSRVMKGMRMQDTGEHEVREVVSLLTPLISSCKASFNAQEVADTVAGLSKMTSTRGEVLVLLRVLTPMIATCREPLNAQQVAMVMGGLCGCCSKRSEVKGLLVVITRLIENCKEKLNGKKIELVLKGLERKHSEHAEVRNLVRFLNPLLVVHNHESTPTSQDGMLKQQLITRKKQQLIMRKLRGLNANIPEVASLVKALSSHRVPESRERAANLLEKRRNHRAIK